MSDDLLRYYSKELEYLRKLGAEFSGAYPKVAGRLRISKEGAVDDPHVSRLVESVAFLNARVRKKLEDDFPELTDALLSVLYPHLLSPIPSMAIVQFECDPELTTGHVVPAEAALETEAIDGDSYRYRTCYPTTAWPIRIAEAQLAVAPFSAPAVRGGRSAAVIRLQLRCATDTGSFAVLRPRSLRFFLNAPAQQAYALYDLIFNNTVEVAIATSAKDRAPQVLPKSCIQPVGFGKDEGMLPYSDRSFLGYRLLSEYFGFPAKFLFFDLNGIADAKLREMGKVLEIYLYLDRTIADLEQNVSSETFALGCTPVVNLFRRRAEPIQIANEVSEYRVIADARRPRSVEVYSVDQVRAIKPSGEVVKYLPFYGLDHGGVEQRDNAWWHAHRRAAPPGPDRQDRGTETYISLLDLAHQSVAPGNWVLEVETTCTNRVVASRRPIGTRLRLSEGGGPIREIRVPRHFAPTATVWPAQGNGAMWRLISHLSLNHLSLAGGKEATEALREILRLYDLRSATEDHPVIKGLRSVQSAPTTMRVVSGGMPGICRGTGISIDLQESYFTGFGMYLFGCVLDRFLGLYSSTNSFIRLSITTDTLQGVRYQWAPRAGDRPLL